MALLPYKEGDTPTYISDYNNNSGTGIDVKNPIDLGNYNNDFPIPDATNVNNDITEKELAGIKIKYIIMSIVLFFLVKK